MARRPDELHINIPLHILVSAKSNLTCHPARSSALLPIPEVWSGISASKAILLPARKAPTRQPRRQQPRHRHSRHSDPPAPSCALYETAFDFPPIRRLHRRNRICVRHTRRLPRLVRETRFQHPCDFRRRRTLARVLSPTSSRIRASSCSGTNAFHDDNRLRLRFIQCFQRVENRAALKRMAPGGKFIQDDPEAKRRRWPERLLRRAIAPATYTAACLPEQELWRCRRQILRQPEVQHLNESVRAHHQVFGLNVTMNDAARMRRR